MDPKLSTGLVFLALLSIGLYGTLAYTVWNLQGEVHSLRKNVKTVSLRRDEASNFISSLKQITQRTRRDSTSQSATEILTNALTELIEKKLITLMDCNINDRNLTDCSLKPGPKGEKGSTGETGVQGKDGPKGEQGSVGSKGNDGLRGPQGSIGERGPKGDTGEVGIRGGTGPQGPLGATGEIGIRGEPGMKGNKGHFGYPGYKGSVGPTGLKGEHGERGATGFKGEPGLKGMKGSHGYTGYKGEKGQKGMAGSQGPPGQRGSPGANTTTSYPEGCGGSGWRRVTFINMTDPTQNCPQGLNLTPYSKRSCGRAGTGGRHCSSVTFIVGAPQYSQVCGRARAYQFAKSYAFYGYNRRTLNIDGNYVDGLSLTHGVQGSRTHIWTFASGLFERSRNDSLPGPAFHCPCDDGNTYSSPPFVGNDYFCESAPRTWPGPLRLFPNNVLWDGQGCGTNNRCCQLNSPPWFTKVLPNPTSDNIELRLCLYDPQTVSNIALELLEIYVK